MSVRKRKWTTEAGEQREAWVVDFTDQAGRHIKMFERKKEAHEYLARVGVAIADGIHTSSKMTVAQASEVWLADARQRLARSSVAIYGQMVKYHINPFLGSMRLSDLTVPVVRSFADTLRDSGRSHSMVQSVVGALGSILADAQERGQVAQNVVRSMNRRKQRTKLTQRRKLQVGINIPSPAEIRALIHELEGRWRPFILTAIFTGLRSSELRGLCWNAIDMKAGLVHVRQRADRYGDIDKPKSTAGERVVPLPPLALNALREWCLRCPRSHIGLVFPTSTGAIQDRANLVRVAHSAWTAAGIVTPDGKPKYTGLHCFRHFFASWCINRPQDGGLGLPLKVVQHRLGHSTINMTADVYGHLFPAGDDSEELARAEKLLLS